MDLPKPYLKLNNLMGLCSLPNELVSQFTMKTELALLGRKHPRLKLYLPKSYVWYSRNQTDEESLKELESFFLAFEKSSVNIGSSGGCTWVVKKEGMSRGRGVNVLTPGIELRDLKMSKEYGLSLRKPSLVQRYIQNPLLLPVPSADIRAGLDLPMANLQDIGYKWDFRMYALMIMDNETSSISCYLYKDGFARRCAKPYRYVYDCTQQAELLAKGNPRDSGYLQTHLTNSFVNCKHGDNDLKEYIQKTKQLSNLSELERRFLPLFDDDDDDDNYFNNIKSNSNYDNDNKNNGDDGKGNGLDSKDIKHDNVSLPLSMTLDEAWSILTDCYGQERIEKAKLDIIDMFAVLFRVVVESYSVNQQKQSQSQSQLSKTMPQRSYKKSFSFFGLDGILDTNMKPWILEVNKSPDLRCYTMNQFRIKKQLLLDTFAMVFDVNPEEFIINDDLEAAFTALNSRHDSHSHSHSLLQSFRVINTHPGDPKRVPAWSSPSQTTTPTQAPTENPSGSSVNPPPITNTNTNTNTNTDKCGSWVQIVI